MDKTALFGKDATSINEAESQGDLLNKVTSADIIQTNVKGMLEDLKENINRGGNKYNLIKNFVSTTVKKYTAISPEGYSMGITTTTGKREFLTFY